MLNVMLITAEEGTINPLLPTIPDLVWSSIVFLIVLVAFAKFIMPKFIKILEERTEKIEGGLEKAQKAQEEAQAILSNNQEQINEARDMAAKIKDDAKSEGQEIIKSSKLKAQEEADRIIESAHTELGVQKRQLITQMRKDLGNNAVAIAEKLVGHELDKDTKKSETVDRFISEVESLDSKSDKAEAKKG